LMKLMVARFIPPAWLLSADCGATTCHRSTR
jgi:hypothetical protein